MLTIGSLGR